jgi:outer membrane biogenesis lipoprotein LolB
VTRTSGRRSAATLRAPLTAIALAAALAGCATPAARTPAAVTEVAAPRDWSGRFSVTLQPHVPDAASDNSGGRFELTAFGPAMNLTLYSPFGQTIASAERRPDGSASLQLADGRRLHAENLDRLLHRALGHPMPVERLPDWLDRRFEQVLRRDAAGEPIDALDSGWRIRLDDRRWQMQRIEPTGTLTVLLLLDR